MDDPRFARLYLTLSSIAGPGGTSTEFEAPLGQQLSLPGEPGEYEVALVELSVSTQNALAGDDLLIFCDLIPSNQIVGVVPQPLLRSILGAETITFGASEKLVWYENNTIVPWRPLAATSFSTVAIRVANSAGDALPPGADASTVVLCIRHLTRS